MTDLFLDVLNVSFSATWVVLGVVLARLLLKKAPRWMVCALWALVALRLIFGGIEAPFSLIPSAEIIPPQSLYDQTPAIHSGISSLDNVVNPIYSEALRPAPGASVNPLQVWLAVYANFWFLGMVAMFLWAVFSWHRVRRQVQASIPAGDGVYLCDRISSPFIFGLLRPKIFLPSGLDDSSRDHVIAHERAHLARRDHWWKPLGFALLAVNWFNPAMWLAYALLCRDIEMACDEKVVRHFGTEERKAYSAALLQCSINPRPLNACPLAFGEVGVKKRVKSVLHYKKPAFWIILAAVVLSFVLAAGFLTNPAKRTSEIRYNGNLYVLFNQDYSFLPVEEPVGELRSILHHTDEHPTEDFQATNLDESLAGCPLYLEGDQLYLIKYDGSCLAFRLKYPNELLRELLDDGAGLTLNLATDNTFTTEVLTGGHQTAMQSVLYHVANLTLAPGKSDQVCDVSITLRDTRKQEKAVHLWRIPGNTWVLSVRDKVFGYGTWLFQSPELDKAVTAYEDRAAYGDAFFDEPLYADAIQNVQIVYSNYYDHGHHLRVGIPCYLVEWDWEAHTTKEHLTGFRCNPVGAKGTMTVVYTNQILSFTDYRSEPFSFGNGIRGIRYYAEGAAHPRFISLDSRSGQLLADIPDGIGWSERNWQEAEFILSTIEVTDADGHVLLGPEVISPGDSKHHQSFQFVFEDLEPNAVQSLTKDLTVSGGYLSWSAAWDRPDCELMVILRSADGAEYADTGEGGESFGVFKNIPDGRYELLIHSVWKNQFTDSPSPLSGSISTEVQAPQISTDLIQSPDGDIVCLFPSNEGPDLGISLRAMDITCRSLRLFCTQKDGTNVLQQILTTPAWTLEKWVDGTGWVNVTPEHIGWDDVLLPIPINGTTAWNIDFDSLLQAGTYRIGKTFYGQPEPDDPKSTTQALEQTCYAEFEVNPLGITMDVRNITPNGATLICTQNGTAWDSIITGAPWNLEHYEDGQWVGALPAETLWTAIAYSIDRGTTRSWNLNWSLIVGSLSPGRYRVSKTFTGTQNHTFTSVIENNSITQTCYAEFILK